MGSNRQVALLRGINVGKNNRVPMATLRDLLAGLGYTDVRTHLNSGNAVFSVPTGRLRDVDADSFAPERFQVAGREIYLWLPEGMQNSELAKTLTDQRLGVAATSRNWNTVTRLLELAG